MQLKKTSRIEVVFDDYRNVSIKNVERNRRSSGNQLLFKTIVSSTVIKQWPLFLSCNENKNALIAFVVSKWKKEKYRSLIENKCVYVTDAENVFKINHDSIFLVENLKSNHEEAGIRMTLHAKYASNSYDRILIASPDTDVFVLCVSFQNYIDGRIYFLSGVKNSRRIIEIKAVGENFVTSMNVCNATDELFLASIIGFHSFTGCDTVSTFSGRGEAKPLKPVTKILRYTEAFSMFGKEITLPDSLVNTLENFVCHMYGRKENDVDNVRYRMYCKSGRKISCDGLPPCSGGT